MLVLAIVLLAYVLEPILRAGDDHVEVDAAIDAPQVPDFRALLEDDGEVPDAPVEGTPSPVQQPEPAEHRS